MLSPIKTFFELPVSHKWLFVKISVLIPLFEVGIRVLGFKRTFRFLRLLQNGPKEPVEAPRVLINRHRNLAVLFTRRFPILGNCLAQSLALWLLLQRKGVETDLKFGMKKEKKNLLGHAWLEYEGTPLASKEELEENYAFFSDSILTKLG